MGIGEARQNVRESYPNAHHLSRRFTRGRGLEWPEAQGVLPGPFLAGGSATERRCRGGARVFFILTAAVTYGTHSSTRRADRVRHFDEILRER